MKAIRTTQLSDRQLEVLLELYKPIATLPVFYQKHPEDEAFWITPERQKQIDGTGRIISRLTNLKLLIRSRGSKAVKLSSSGVALAAKLWRERHGTALPVA